VAMTILLMEHVLLSSLLGETETLPGDG